jgi:predicted site-specific integrase-resolvase
MSKTFVRRRRLAERYDVTPRTIDRWVRDGRLPAPIYRGRTPLWDVDELDAHDRQATIERASSKTQGNDVDPVQAAEQRKTEMEALDADKQASP